MTTTEVLLLGTGEVGVDDLELLRRKGFMLIIYSVEGVAMFVRRRTGGHRKPCMVKR